MLLPFEDKPQCLSNYLWKICNSIIFIIWKQSGDNLKLKLASHLRVGQLQANPKVIQKSFSFSKRMLSTVRLFVFGRLADFANLWWFPRSFWPSYCSKQLQNTLIILLYNWTTSLWKFFEIQTYIFPLIAAVCTIGELLGCDCAYIFLNVSFETSCSLWVIFIWLLIILEMSLYAYPTLCKLKMSAP